MVDIWSAGRVNCNTMETDDSFRMNHSLSGLIRFTEKAHSVLARKGKLESSLIEGVEKVKEVGNRGAFISYELPCFGSISLRSLIKCQSDGFVKAVELNSAYKLKTSPLGPYKQLLLLINLLIVTLCPTQAAFWTFYFPNFLKPSGYKELTSMIDKVQNDMNVTKDTYADAQHFWTLMREMDTLDTSSMYPEESVCSEVFPIFRDLAIDYATNDYEFFISPMEEYYNHLIEMRTKYYPEGPKSKTILPRELEQRLYEKEIELKIYWLSQLTNEPEYRKKREKMVSLWKRVKRSLDSSLQCLYLRYSFRQVAEDINQLALDMNLQSMNKALDMIQSAFKRIAKFKGSDQEAMKQIEEVVMREERFKINP